MTPLLNRLRASPWLTTLLAVLLLASLALSHHRQAPPALLSWYQDSGLATMEWQDYLTWLHINGHSRKAQWLTDQQQQGNPHAITAALFEHAFRHQQGTDNRFLEPAELQQWQLLDRQVSSQWAASWQYQLALLPAQPRPLSLLTAPWLPAPLLQTLLALALLLPLAAGLEKQRGTLLVFCLWLVGSLFAGAGYWLASRAGHPPFYGATAPLLTFAGAWLVAWKRETITVSVRQLTLTVPASLAALPALLPVGISLLESPAPLPQSAALVGALAGGALLMMALNRRPQPATQCADTSQTLPASVQDALYQGWRALENGDGERACDFFQQALNQQPDHFDALGGMLVAQQLSNRNDWQPLCLRLLAQPAQEQGQPQQLRQLWQKMQPQLGTLPPQTGWPLVNTLIRADALNAAEQLASQLPRDQDHCAARENLYQALTDQGLLPRAQQWSS